MWESNPNHGGKPANHQDTKPLCASYKELNTKNPARSLALGRFTMDWEILIILPVSNKALVFHLRLYYPRV